MAAMIDDLVNVLERAKVGIESAQRLAKMALEDDGSAKGQLNCVKDASEAISEAATMSQKLWEYILERNESRTL